MVGVSRLIGALRLVSRRCWQGNTVVRLGCRILPDIQQRMALEIEKNTATEGD